MKATILDGKKVADEILRDLKETTPVGKFKLVVAQVGKNAVSEQYIAEKQRVAEEIGIAFESVQFPETISQENLQKEIQKFAKDSRVSGIVVQLPLPKKMHIQGVLNEIPVEKDVDVLSSASLEKFKNKTLQILPPTVGAVQALFSFYGIEMKEKKVVLVGFGKLVGMPMSIWLKNKDVSFKIATKETEDLAALTLEADIVISGVGKTNLITGEMIKEGSVIVDAGTSVEQGKTTGDIDFASVEKCASFVSPVPGGVGPLTVVCLLRNLVTLSS